MCSMSLIAYHHGSREQAGRRVERGDSDKAFLTVLRKQRRLLANHNPATAIHHQAKCL